MRPPGSPAQLESRRRKAIQLLDQGMTVTATANRVKSSISSVVRWQQAYRKKGDAGLAPKKALGRPAKLSSAQKRKLVDLLLEGPMAFGYSTNLWTTRRVAEVIQREFGIHYHANHIWRVLTGLGWSCQKPERRARERDEMAIEEWRKKRWPAIKKNSCTWGPSGVSG
ncbi:MAG: IS630 family transposase [Candidatus Aminicenantales bacterium]